MPEACQIGEIFGPLAQGAAEGGGPSHRFVARQPILNARREVAGYELLFRSGWETSFSGEANDASRRMLDHCVCMGIETLAGRNLAFVNCTREALLGRLVTLLNPATTVLEILETVEPDAGVVKACGDLKRLGYKLALDDFLPRPEMRPLIEMADYVKVDFRQTDAAMRTKIHSLMRGTTAALLAEKVEDQAEFSQALDEGYEYFQGYFFCRPKTVSSREIPANRLNYLRLVAELMREPLRLEEVRRIVRMEASLLYRLLRLANSAMWGRSKEVTSVRDAFMLVGEERFRVLISVAASCVLGDEQPPALISLALARARFCELVAARVGEAPGEQFMLGLLSLVDAMLEVPMESVVNSLPLRREARDALMGVMNPAAMPLCMIRSFEAGAWGSCAGSAMAMRIGEETLTRLYLEAVKWAEETLASSG